VFAAVEVLKEEGPLLSLTIAKYVTAIGGPLHVIADFGDATFVIC